MINDLDFDSKRPLSFEILAVKFFYFGFLHLETFSKQKNGFNKGKSNVISSDKLLFIRKENCVAEEG